MNAAALFEFIHEKPVDLQWMKIENETTHKVNE